ncbi:MAG: murein transglycosylase A [Pseudomonadota bacterium]
MAVSPIDADALPGWRDQGFAPALAAFNASCAAHAARPDEAPFNPIEALGDDRLSSLAGDVGDWRGVCAAAAEISSEEARAFFETAFTALRLSLQETAAPALFRKRPGDKTTGVLTGYYEPEIKGALEPSEAFSAPLLSRPDDLIMVDLGAFRPDLAGVRIAGFDDGGRLRPYADRAAIEAGALGEQGAPLAWVDPVEAFFLQIQGSGRVALADGQPLRVGYDGQNGHPYTAIGRVLVERGDLELEDASLASIKTWLRAHPEEAAAVMNTNASYVFFRAIEEGAPSDGPLGAQGVPLTADASLAVDRRYHAMGTPIWVAEAEGESRYARLMIAQDTGGAIRGPLRGDAFRGTGAAAGAAAGGMRRQTEFVLFLPPALAAAATKALGQ